MPLLMLLLLMQLLLLPVMLLLQLHLYSKIQGGTGVTPSLLEPKTTVRDTDVRADAARIKNTSTTFPNRPPGGAGKKGRKVHFSQRGAGL